MSGTFDRLISFPAGPSRAKFGPSQCCFVWKWNKRLQFGNWKACELKLHDFIRSQGIIHLLSIKRYLKFTLILENMVNTCCFCSSTGGKLCKHLDYAMHSQLLLLLTGIHFPYRFNCYLRVTRLLYKLLKTDLFPLVGLRMPKCIYYVHLSQN